MTKPRLKKQDHAQSSARGSSFYAAMRLMPAHQREAMYEIYHFCRTLDDIADEEGPVPERLEQLRQWREDIARLYQGNNSTITLRSLAKAVAEFSLRREDLLAVVDGMEMDVRGPMHAPDAATLALYCDRVACAVGRLCVRVFGLPEQDGLQLAHHLGNALQLTNILRDLDEDALVGRLYLPKELLLGAGITTIDPLKVLESPCISIVCENLAEKAQSHFREADAIMKRYDRRQVRAPRLMSQAYRAIFAALVGRGFASPRRPVRLSKAKLGYILLSTGFF